MCTLFVASNVFVVSVHSLFTDNSFDFQIILYIILSFMFIIGLWTLLFAKIKLPMKIFIFLSLLIIQLSSTTFPSVNKVFNMETCIDTGICPEGLNIKIDGELVEINKDNCLKYNRQWDDIRKTCNIRKSIDK